MHRYMCHSIQLALTAGYNCTCFPGWTGYNCQTNINECASTPCMNGGTCIVSKQFVSHTLNKFWFWVVIVRHKFISKTEANLLISMQDRIDYYTCHCALGFYGLNCETDVDECSSNPCKNGGDCTVSPASWVLVHSELHD